MTYLTLLLLILNGKNNQLTEAQCFEIFDEQKFTKVIETCSNIDNPTTKLSMIIVASEFFKKIPYIRVNEIFHHGTGGQYLYELVFKKKLLTKYEENTLIEYFGQFKQFADLGEPIAQVLTAKLFYIIEYILKNKENSNFDAVKFNQMKLDLYTKNLDKYIQVFSEDPEILLLLGIEGVTYAHAQNDNNGEYFEIKNQRYYDYLIKANKLKHPKAQRYIDGVEAYIKYLNKTKELAGDNDANALFEIGFNLYHKEKDNKENIQQASIYFEKAALQNHVSSLKWLTRIYSQDSPSLEKYLKTQNKLVKLNDSNSMLELGDYFLCNKNINKAKQLYEKAKNLNNPLAQIALEDLKYDGEPSNGCR